LLPLDFDDGVEVADNELDVPDPVPDAVGEAVVDAVLLLVPLYANFVLQGPSYSIGSAKFVPVTLLYASLTKVFPEGKYFGHPP
jgi:hypothetical protein